MESELRTVALHESAHSLVHYILGFPTAKLVAQLVGEGGHTKAGEISKPEPEVCTYQLTLTAGALRAIGYVAEGVELNGQDDHKSLQNFSKAVFYNRYQNREECVSALGLVSDFERCLTVEEFENAFIPASVAEAKRLVEKYHPQITSLCELLLSKVCNGRAELSRQEVQAYWESTGLEFSE